MAEEIKTRKKAVKRIKLVSATTKVMKLSLIVPKSEQPKILNEINNSFHSQLQLFDLNKKLFDQYRQMQEDICPGFGKLTAELNTLKYLNNDKISKRRFNLSNDEINNFYLNWVSQYEEVYSQLKPDFIKSEIDLLLNKLSVMNKIIKVSEKKKVFYKNLKLFYNIEEKKIYNDKKVGTGTYYSIRKAAQAAYQKVINNRIDGKSSRIQYPKPWRSASSIQIKPKYQALKSICDQKPSGPLKFDCVEEQFLHCNLTNKRFGVSLLLGGGAGGRPREIIKAYAKHNGMYIPDDVLILDAKIISENKGYDKHSFYLILTLEGSFIYKNANNDKIIGLDWGHREKTGGAIKCYYGSSDDVIETPKPFVMDLNNKIISGDLPEIYAKNIFLHNQNTSVEIHLPKEIREKSEQLKSIISNRQLCADHFIEKNKSEMGRSKSMVKLLKILESKNDLSFEETSFIKNEKRLKLKCDLLNIKIVNVRREFFRKVFLKINNNFGVVVFEDIVKQQMNDMDTAAHAAHRKRSNRDLVTPSFCEGLCSNKKYVPARNTTKHCYKCGKSNNIGSSEEYLCSCGVSVDRDFNASQNIKNLAVAKNFSTRKDKCK